MIIQPKSPETIEAQVAAFATENIADHRNAAYVLGNVSMIAATNPEEVRRTTDQSEVPVDEHGMKQFALRVRAGTEIVAAERASYVAFLRARNGERHTPIRERAEILANYAVFEPTAARLANSVEQSDDRSSHPEFKGSGLTRSAFVFEQDSTEYILRLVRTSGKGQDSANIDRDMTAYLRGRGIPHIEQVVAASYDKGHFITEAFPGDDLSAIDAPKASETITVAQLETLLDTVTVASELGITVDPKMSNVMYDSDDGFNIIDYGTARPDDRSVLANNSINIAVALSNMGRIDHDPLTAEAHARNKDQIAAAVSVVRAYADTLTQRMGDTEGFSAIREAITEQIADHEAHLADLANPAWVAEQLAKRQRQAEMAAAFRRSTTGSSRSPSDTV